MSNFELILSNLQEWGYWVVFIGSIFEGELILLSSSAAAALGYLDIHKIFIIAFNFSFNYLIKVRVTLYNFIFVVSKNL